MLEYYFSKHWIREIQLSYFKNLWDWSKMYHKKDNDFLRHLIHFLLFLRLKLHHFSFPFRSSKPSEQSSLYNLPRKWYCPVCLVLLYQLTIKKNHPQTCPQVNLIYNTSQLKQSLLRGFWTLTTLTDDD